MFCSHSRVYFSGKLLASLLLHLLGETLIVDGIAIEAERSSSIICCVYSS
jgi:hypothetical protein